MSAFRGRPVLLLRVWSILALSPCLRPSLSQWDQRGGLSPSIAIVSKAASPEPLLLLRPHSGRTNPAQPYTISRIIINILKTLLCMGVV